MTDRQQYAEQAISHLEQRLKAVEAMQAAQSHPVNTLELDQKLGDLSARLSGLEKAKQDSDSRTQAAVVREVEAALSKRLSHSKLAEALLPMLEPLADDLIRTEKRLSEETQATAAKAAASSLKAANAASANALAAGEFLLNYAAQFAHGD